MSEPRLLDRRTPALLLACCCLAVLSPHARADETEPRVEAGSCLSPSPSLLHRERANKAWQVVGANEKIYTRDTLMVLPGDKGAIEPRPQSVALTLWGNLPQQSLFPGLQSAIVLHDTKAFDLDFTLLTGRVVVRNNRPRGAVKVWVRLPREGWQLTLPEPGDEVALELYGRWPRGVAFSKEPRPGDAPTGALDLFVIKGQLELKTPVGEYPLNAPPGPALFHWDSIAGPDHGPTRVVELPAWADPKAKTPDEALLVAGIVQRLQNRLKDKAPDDALADLLAAADRDNEPRRAALTREITVLCMAALDDLSHVADALADTKHPEMRDAAVTALRHWIGAGSGRDAQLYRVLVEHSRLSLAQAETVMSLLHSPFAADEPETFETLIAYLQHGQLAVRELARWHLYRLAPAGGDIKYDAAAPEAERAKAVEQWKKLIPRGQLPPPLKEKPKP
jgi:hypothetical protein